MAEKQRRSSESMTSYNIRIKTVSKSHFNQYFKKTHLLQIGTCANPIWTSVIYRTFFIHNSCNIKYCSMINFLFFAVFLTGTLEQYYYYFFVCLYLLIIEFTPVTSRIYRSLNMEVLDFQTLRCLLRCNDAMFDR